MRPLIKNATIDFQKTTFKLRKIIKFIPAINILKGINGSGKTTTLRLITRLIPSESQIDLVNPNSESEQSFMNQNVYLQLDNVNFDLEYIKLKKFAKLRNFSLQQLNLVNYADTLIINLSHGTRKKIAILEGLASKKNILLYDEITNGIDDQSINEIANLFLNSEKQIIIATHDQRIIQLLKESHVIEY